MGRDELILPKPPVVQVQATVSFPDSFAVSDSRGAFHALVRGSFPRIVIPERSALRYDLGDYALESVNMADRLEVGMNYFRLTTAAYPGFSSFRRLFSQSFDGFVTCYGLRDFTQFTLQYNNQLSRPSPSEFDDFFSIVVQVPPAIVDSYFAARGTLIFSQGVDFLAAELEPQWSETSALSGYKLNLSYLAYRALVVDSNRNDVASLLESAHDVVKSYFFELLSNSYLEHLQRRD